MLRKVAQDWLRLLVLVGLGVAGVSLTACNTTEGIGEDVEEAGDEISDTAEDLND